MKKKLEFRSCAIIVTVMALMFGAVSCNKEPEGERPVLPPSELLFMTFGDFNEEPAATKSALASYDNFIYAYVTLLFWHTPPITLTTALPVAAYGYALTQEPEYLGNNTWQWSFDYQLGQNTYVVTLTASRSNNEEFSINMDVALADYPALAVKWFDGVVRYDHTHATWTIYKEGITAVVDAEVNHDFEAHTGDLMYTYVEPDMEETGSYILYEYDQAAAYDASYTVSVSTGMTEIEWSTDTKEGHVMDEVHFGDTDWHCWDSLANGLVDKICD